ncbi:hypothetical protein BC567DRAFT_92196 [Phyllosticta citribraziliensis]
MGAETRQRKAAEAITRLRDRSRVHLLACVFARRAGSGAGIWPLASEQKGANSFRAEELLGSTGHTSRVLCSGDRVLIHVGGGWCKDLLLTGSVSF